MQWLSLARPAVGGLFGVALVLGPTLGATAQTAAAKKDNFERIKFETADRVEIHGTFFPAARGARKAPCVMLLHNLGGKSQEDGWDQLAAALQQKGFAVLSFDFRGHGASTSVSPEFWRLPNNVRGLRGGNTLRPKESISYKDFLGGYEPMLANDIAAAKLFLDRKNDAGECNSANLILIGAQEGAALGVMWMASEFNRYRVPNPQQPFKLESTPEGSDLVAGIWLSITPSLRGTRIPLANWLTFTAREKKVPMAFLHGDGDAQGAAIAKSLVNSIKAGREELKLTDSRAIKDTKLTGPGLLQKSLETQDWIVSNYLDKVMEKHGNNEWDQREVEKAQYVWTFTSIPIVAKLAGEKSLLPLPLGHLGVR